MKIYKKFAGIILGLYLALSISAQNTAVKTGIVGFKMSDFTLPTYQGGTFSMEKTRGKNVLLVVSRGRYADSNWCAICNYQYSDFADLEKKEQIQKQYNLEIVFLMPYGKADLMKWEQGFAHSLDKIEKWKHPENENNLNDEQKDWTAFARGAYPKTFVFPQGKVELPFPVLMDENHEVSKGLDLFRMEWDYGKTAQNIPAVYLMDQEGIIRFKYISQNTTDRPSAQYVLKMASLLLTRQ
jgi:peroxiredoxin